MGLFFRRPLCFFAFLFVAFSCLVFSWRTVDVFRLCLVLAILTLLFFASLFLWKKGDRKQWGRLTCAISLLVATVAVGYSLLTVFLPYERAKRFEGEHVFVAEILREEYRADDYTRYSVNLVQIDEEATSIYATLSCYSVNGLSPKDLIAARGTLASPEEKDRGGYLLSVELSEDTEIYGKRVSEGLSFWEILFSRSGILILSERCQTALREKMIDALGARSGALATAFFVGDRSALSPSVVRDFSRSGVSHLMAVSGLHFSVLLGTIELLLRKLRCPKRARLVIVTAASVFFLFLTGFSMSACRSAMMLYVLYLTFLFQEDVDSPTSLFCSLAVIILISPYAVADLGLWMSFLATLGLLTLYPLIAKKIPNVCGTGWLCRNAFKLLRSALMLILMTTVATLFLLPILWIYFGEISTVSLLSNPILAPISYVFLVMVPTWLLLNAIPLLGTVFGVALSWVGECILWLVSCMSRLPSATVSLHDRFCFVLIPLFAAAMIAVLVIRLRRKWLILLPPTVFILAFGLCFTAVRLHPSAPCVTYTSLDRKQEILWVLDRDELAICDVSGGSPWLYQRVMDEISSSTATEIQTLLLTHYHPSHTASMDVIFQSKMVRTLYLPNPQNEADRTVAAGIWSSAVEAGSEVLFYGEGNVALTDRVFAQISFGKSDPFAVAMTLSGETERLSYVSEAWLAEADETERSELLGESRTVLVGAHGALGNGISAVELSDGGAIEQVIECMAQTPAHLVVEGAEHYSATSYVWSWKKELT